MNSNTGGGEHIANYVELQIIEWAKEMLNFDKKAKRFNYIRLFNGEFDWFSRCQKCNVK